MINYLKEEGKVIFPVPPDIRFISEWNEFSLDLFSGPYIIDKQIPGCGFTEYCLTSSDNLILCSPRKILLENKESQHQGEVFYAKNEFETEILQVDKSLLKKSKIPPKILTTEEILEKNKLALLNMEKSLIKYCQHCQLNGKPIKIIVTYDSFRHVKEILSKRRSENLLSLFKIVIDEFQSVFVDSRFKADTEFGFIRELQGLSNNICFVSATPMLDKYLRQLDYFKDLPYFELDWASEDPGRVIKPELKVRKTKSVCVEMKRIIEEYKNGDFSVLANPLTGELVQSKEAVFYVNSVNDILGIIKKMRLSPGEVNILCANTPQNEKRLKTKLGKGFQIGSVPLRGEPHKMFTFCTRTVYLGADFYSTCARTFILSDANIESLAVDISLDLPQILGRQRLLENPWKNHAEFYFKTLGKGKNISKEDFNKILQEKVDNTKRRLQMYFNLTKDKEKEDQIMYLKLAISTLNYENDYISINCYEGKDFPVFNDLVLVAEQRAFDIQQIDYKDRFTVFNTIKDSNNFGIDKLSQYIDKLRDTKILFSDRLKYLCETQDLTDDEKKLVASQASESFDKYYNLVGPERCKALGYHTTKINKDLLDSLSDSLITSDMIFSEISKFFQVGKKYTNKETKETIREIFNRLGYSKSPKASILNDYYELKMTKALSKEGKWENGFEILKLKI